MSDTIQGSTELLYQVKDIVAAYVSNNALDAADLPRLIASTYEALRELSATPPGETSNTEHLTPAVPIKKSVTPGHIICLECGQPFVSLRRHLAAAHQLTPELYQERWRLPSDYPMVAHGYSQQRSALAKNFGLGKRAAGTLGKRSSADAIKGDADQVG